MSKSLLWAAIGGVAALILALSVGGVLLLRGQDIPMVGRVDVLGGLLGDRAAAGKRVDLDTWAATICAAGEEYVTSITSAISPVDPTTMELTERKANAARLGKIQVDSARALVTALRTVIPPEVALAYHNALIASAEEYIGAIDEQSAAIAAAAGPQQIAVANAQARFRLQANDREVAAIAVNLGPQVTAALEKQPGCGPQPGAPGIAPPGGTRPGGT